MTDTSLKHVCPNCGAEIYCTGQLVFCPSCREPWPGYTRVRERAPTARKAPAEPSVDPVFGDLRDKLRR